VRSGREAAGTAPAPETAAATAAVAMRVGDTAGVCVVRGVGRLGSRDGLAQTPQGGVKEGEDGVDSMQYV